jgi:hypothetical protein
MNLPLFGAIAVPLQMHIPMPSRTKKPGAIAPGQS